MKLGLINSAWAQAGQDTAFGIRMTKEIGFDSIDIFADPYDTDDLERRLIKDECDRVGLPIVSVACVALGLVDFNPSVRRFHFDRVWAYLDMARQFGAKNVLLVLGEYVWQKEVIPPSEQWSAASTCVKALGERARRLNLEIALELEPFAMSLLHDVASMARFLDDVDHPSVKANLDISHLALADQDASTVEKLRGRVGHVHISDSDGKVHGDLPPGRGVVDFPPYLDAIRSLGQDDLTISVELEYSPEPDRIVDWVKDAYESTSRLMKAAGVTGVIRLIRTIPVILALVAVVGWPLVAMVIEATKPEVSTGAESRELIPTARPGEIVRPLGLAFQTARLVLATEAIGLPIGLALAFVLFRTDVWGRRAMLGVVGLAAFVPMPLIATAWMGALGNAGRSQALGFGVFLNGWSGAAFIHAMGCLPWIVAIVGVGLRGVEPDLEESARLDLSPWRVVLQITLRRSLGAVAASALAVLVLTAGDMSVTDLFSVRTYAEESYTQYQSGNGPRASLVALPPLFAFGLLILVGVRGLLKVDPAKVISASSRSRDWRLGVWRVPVGLALVLTLGNFVALPIYSLFWHAGHVVENGQAHWSLAGFGATLARTTAELFAGGLHRPLRAPMVASVILSSAAACLTVALAWTLAWLARKPGPWRWVTAATVALTLAVPGPVAGMALVIAYLNFPWIYDTSMKVILAYMLRTLPYAVLILWPAVRALPEAYLEAASLEGYGPWGQARRVAIPLTLGAIAAAWGVAFALGLGELPAANIAAPPGVMLVAVRIWELLHRGVESHLAGMGLILLGVVALTGSLAAWGVARWKSPGIGGGS